MKNNYPNIKGFTKRNIERMIQFYKTYKDDCDTTGDAIALDKLFK